MTARFVPAVDYDGDTVWLDPHGRVVFLHATETPGADWRRLGWEQEPEPFEHSDMCEDPDSGRPHIDAYTRACWCLCPKCDRDGYCICPMCSRPATHAHRPVTT